MPGIQALLRGQTIQPWIALTLAVILSFILMATSNSQEMELARARISDILGLLTQPIVAYREISNLRSENSRLRAENTELMIQSSGTKEAIRENDRLRSLLGFKKKATLTLKAAEVIGKSPLPGVHSILLDVGRQNGIGKHMAVINDQGLVGKVIRLGEKTAVAQLLLDRNLGAAVRLSDSRIDGITSWRGGENLVIEGVPALAQIRLGELAFTTGLDGVFPAGIPVGEVLHTEKPPEGLFQLVEITPRVSFSTLEEVFIVSENGASKSP